MAPKLAKPNKNKQNGAKKPPAAAGNQDVLHAATATDYAQQQKDEIEVLQSIYMDDFTIIETKSAWGGKQTDRAFKIRLKPMMQSDPDLNVAVTLSVRLSATYPKTLPALEVEDAVGVRPKVLTKIMVFAKTKSKDLLGEVMIYEVAAGIQDILEDEAQFKMQGEALPSLEEQRAAQEAEFQQLAKQEEEAAKLQRQKEQAEEDRMLQQMVEDEMNRRKEVRKKAHTVTAVGNSVSTTESSHIQLDRTCHYQSGGIDLEFSAISLPRLLNTGPLTRVSIVEPILNQTGVIERSCLLVVKQLSVDVATTTDKKRMLDLEDQLELLRKLHHPNIAQVLDFRLDFVDKWAVTILMEFARKGSLSEQLAMFGSLPVSRVRIWTVDLLEALDFLHKNGIVHKRIHCNNILVSQSVSSAPGPAQIKLADAGFQEALYGIRGPCDPKSVISSVSAYWNAPEGDAKTSKTDVWELGIVFLQMLFGLDATRKYTGPSQLIDNLQLTAPLEDIIRKFFRHNVKTRPTAFDLIPSEFLRTEAEIYSRPASPYHSRHGSMVLTQTPSRYVWDWST